MKQLALALVAIAALAGVVGYLASASGQGDPDADPIYGIKIPPGTETGA
jgi:hypothetical protein